MSNEPFRPLSSLAGFDPRQIPVSETGLRLPAVGAAELRPEALRRRFAAPPIWTPELTSEKRFVQRDPVHAAVLIALVQRPDLTVLLTQRTLHLSNHSGQIAFPGGRVDPDDEDATATALREAREEIGLMPAQIKVIGNLPVYVTGSAFIITPVVALVEPDIELMANAHEVEDVFEVPLPFLMDPSHHRRHLMQHEGIEREWYSMPYTVGAQERFIWGATAGMLRNLYRFLSA